MKFYDKVKIFVKAGDGGNGCVSGRREKYIAYGGPDGGDGGNGGNIYLMGDNGESSLINLYYKKQLKAKNGEHGKGSQMNGENADDIVVKVPVGTVVKDLSSGKIVGIVSKHGEKILIAKGGRGGWGNMHFATPTRQFPQFAILGEPGEEKHLELSLQLIADVALVGFPSVGKSSIINTLSNTKAKVADYHFTTLVPNLGVVKHKNKNFVLIDVPGLIDGASKGKGLGIDFLRHVLKSKIWAFVLDASRLDDIFFELKVLKKEIEDFIRNNLGKELQQVLGIDFSKLSFFYEKFDDSTIKLQVSYKNKILFEKFLVFVLNKIDLVDNEILEELLKNLKIYIEKLFNVKIEKIFTTSVSQRKSFSCLLDKLVFLLSCSINEGTLLNERLLPKDSDYLVDKEQGNFIKNVTQIEKDKLIKEGYIENETNEDFQVWEVNHPKLNYYVWVLPWGNKEAELFFYEVMNGSGVSKWLEENGVLPGDIIKVISPYDRKSVRYILWGMSS